MLMENNFYTNTQGLKICFRKSWNEIRDESRPLVIFQSGLVCSDQHSTRLALYLIDQGFDVLFHDYRGHYFSEGKENINDITFENIKNDQIELLQFLNIKKCSMVGHSMGVNIALELAWALPEIVESVILISGTVLPVKDIMFNSMMMELLFPYLKLANQTYHDLFNKIWTYSPHNPLIVKMVQNGGFNSSKVSMKYVEEYIHKLTELGPDIFFQLFHELSRHDILARMEQIKCPALVIGGDQDKVIPWYLQNLIAEKLKKSELYLVKNGSHVPHVDFPEYVQSRILKFLNGVKS
jgi:non-heme chloroperoxidase